MPVDHSEKAFETAIEQHLLTIGGYTKADKSAFDLQRCIDASILIPFIKKTQPAQWKYLEDLQKEKAESTFLDDLCKALDSNNEGCLKVLRHGFKCFGKLFRIAYFAPASGLNPEIKDNYKANRLTVTRQLRYSPNHTNEIDLVISINGIPGTYCGAQESNVRPDLATCSAPI